MGIDVEHFDLTGRNALVLSAETPPGQAIAEAYAEAGARVTPLDTLSASDVAQAVKRAAANMGGLQILASAADRFLAKPVTTITADELAEVMMANYAPSSMPARRASRSCANSGRAEISCWSPTSWANAAYPTPASMPPPMVRCTT